MRYLSRFLSRTVNWTELIGVASMGQSRSRVVGCICWEGKLCSSLFFFIARLSAKVGRQRSPPGHVFVGRRSEWRIFVVWQCKLVPAWLRAKETEISAAISYILHKNYLVYLAICLMAQEGVFFYFTWRIIITWA